MSDLADFLLARIAEDEAVARDVHRGPEWGVAEQRPRQWGEDDDDFEVIGGGKPVARCDPEYGGYFVADHIARWDPVRVLAECDAKRRIVERYQRAQAAVETDQRRVAAGGYSDERGTVGGWGVSELRPVLQLLALPFADHQDYRDAWRP